MKIVNYFLPIAFFVSSLSSLQAQVINANYGGKGMLGLNSLDLSSEQEVELRTIFDQHRSEWNEIKEALPGNYHRFQIVKKQLEIDLVNVLTSAQKAEYNKMRDYRLMRSKHSNEAKEMMKDEYRFVKKNKVSKQYNFLTGKRAILDDYISDSDKESINELRVNLQSGLSSWKRGFENWEDKLEDRSTLLQDLITLRDLTDKYILEINDLIQSDSKISELFMHPNECGGENPNLGSGRAAIFMLIDSENENGIAKDLLKSSMNAYPNPVQSELTVDYHLPYSGDIQLILSDENGNIIKRIYSGFQEDGDHQIKVNTKELNTRSYILNLLDQTGQNVQKVIVTKEY